MASLTAALNSDTASTTLTLDWNALNLANNPQFRYAPAATYNEWRHNLVYNPASTSTFGWAAGMGASGGTATISAMTGSGVAGGPDGFVRMTITAPGTGAVASVGPIGGNPNTTQIEALGGYPWTVSAWVRSSVADRTAAFTVTFHDGAGTQLSPVLQGATVAVGAGWTKLTATTTSVPANAVRAYVRVYGVGGSNNVAGTTFDVCGLSAEYTTSTTMPYFDGSTALTATETSEGYVRDWAGTVGQSQSRTRLPFPWGPFNPYQAQSVAGGRVTLADGSTALRIHTRFDVTAGQILLFATIGLAAPVTSGTTYSMKFEARTTSGVATSLQARLAAYDNGSVNVGSGALSASVTIPADGTWVPVTTPGFVAPSTAVSMRPIITRGSTAMPAETVLEFRAVQIEPRATPSPAYFDGNMVGYRWQGTPDQSFSEIIPTSAATIRRVNVTQGSVSTVRNAEPATLVAGGWVGADYEAPTDDTFYYYASSTDAPGFILATQSMILPSNGVTWLKHPGRPSLNTTVRVGVAPNVTRPVSQGVFEVLGRQMPVAVSMRRSMFRGDLQLVTFDETERNALLLLLDDGTPLLLQAPSGYGIGNVYISVGDVSEERATGVGSEWARRWTLPFVVVDRPAGAALAVGNTWSDVLSAYASWDAMRIAEGTWTGVVEGVGA